MSEPLITVPGVTSELTNVYPSWRGGRSPPKEPRVMNAAGRNWTKCHKYRERGEGTSGSAEPAEIASYVVVPGGGAAPMRRTRVSFVGRHPVKKPHLQVPLNRGPHPLGRFRFEPRVKPPSLRGDRWREERRGGSKIRVIGRTVFPPSPSGLDSDVSFISPRFQAQSLFAQPEIRGLQIQPIAPG